MKKWKRPELLLVSMTQIETYVNAYANSICRLFFLR